MSLVVFCFGLGVEDGIRNMNMSEPVPQLNPPRTMMPNVAYRPPASGPSVPVVRPQAASPMRPPDAAAAWRGMAPVPMAQAYPASSSTPTFYSATHGDSDDDSFDASSMMSAVSYLVLFTLVAFHFCRAMLCKHGLCRHAVSVCLSVARFYELGLTRDSRVIPGLTVVSVLSTSNLGLNWD